MVSKKEHILNSLSYHNKTAETPITLKEFTEILTQKTSHRAKPLTEEHVTMVWDTVDSGGGGCIPCELIAALWSHEPLDRELLLKFTFSFCDVDQNGTLSVAEFTTLAEKQDPLSVSMQQAVFTMVDTNADCKIQESEFISFNLESGSQMRDAEFARACGRWTKLAGERGRRLDRDALLRKTFAQIDVDDSGSICESEYMTLAANNDKMSLDIQKIVFAMADTSGDGILEEEEFVRFNLETGEALNDLDFSQQCRKWTFFARGRV